LNIIANKTAHDSKRHQHADEMQYAFWQVGGDELAGGSQTRRYEERDEKKETKCQHGGERQYVIAGEVPQTALFGLLNFPYDVKRVLQLDDDADGSEQQSAYPEDGCKSTFGGTACACQHRLDRLRAGVAQHPF
jgi:hypothetical protein